MNEKIETKIKPKMGGKRPGSGRKKGTPNKLTAELKQLASQHTAEAVQVFVDVMRDPEAPGAVRIAAADKLLDRGHGRPAIHVDSINNKIDAELLEKIEREFLPKLEEARQRQRLVYIERGIIKEGDDF